MKPTYSDSKVPIGLAALLAKVDNLNEETVHRLSDEMFQSQPFFLAVLLGYRLDVTPEELEEIMKIYFLIWEYFKGDKNVLTKKITEDDFEKTQTRHIAMLKYTDGESDEEEISNIYARDLDKIKSKSLLAAVLFRYNTRPALMRMDGQTKGIILFGIKGFIECFEALTTTA